MVIVAFFLFNNLNYFYSRDFKYQNCGNQRSKLSVKLGCGTLLFQSWLSILVSNLFIVPTHLLPEKFDQSAHLTFLLKIPK